MWLKKLIHKLTKPKSVKINIGRIVIEYEFDDGFVYTKEIVGRYNPNKWFYGKPLNWPAKCYLNERLYKEQDTGYVELDERWNRRPKSSVKRCHIEEHEHVVEVKEFYV